MLNLPGYRALSATIKMVYLAAGVVAYRNLDVNGIKGSAGSKLMCMSANSEFAIGGPGNNHNQLSFHKVPN
ncbi:hypothetical protein [Halioxenophilus sp. WMMB6]|uniref:hypothetical protein n=1 Tax=Halioxenophilus sp. WMMB6 TaxID=3073815 RepID=UPI00295EFD46|nr:hypothetical protein [Halioxenophilus sp. WMMB6]